MSWSCSWSHKKAYDLVKIKAWSRKQSHKFDGIGVGRIRMFPYLPILFMTPSLCRSRKQKRKNQPIAKSRIEHCRWFILLLLLATLTMQFSLDRKQRRHKQNQCSASNSDCLIFTRSYCSTLLITTPTTTPSLVKTSPGVSIKFEVGSWLKKNNRMYEQGAVRPISLGGCGGMLPQKILKSGGSEMPFPAFWAPNYHASTSGNYSVCMAI